MPFKFNFFYFRLLVIYLIFTGSTIREVWAPSKKYVTAVDVSSKPPATVKRLPASIGRGDSSSASAAGAKPASSPQSSSVQQKPAPPADGVASSSLPTVMRGLVQTPANSDLLPDHINKPVVPLLHFPTVKKDSQAFPPPGITGTDLLKSGGAKVKGNAQAVLKKEKAGNAPPKPPKRVASDEHAATAVVPHKGVQPYTSFFSHDGFYRNDPDLEGSRLRKALAVVNHWTRFDKLIPLAFPSKKGKAKTTFGKEVDAFATAFPQFGDQFLHQDIMEIVISFTLGDRLGMDLVIHPGQHPSLIKRLIGQGYPQAIRYCLSHQDSRDPHTVLEDIVYDSDDIVRMTEDLLYPAKNTNSQELHPRSQELYAQFPSLRNDLRLLDNNLPLLRPCRLFRTMGDLLYEGMQFMIRFRGYGRQAEKFVIFPISFYLLARRYEDHSAQPLARRVHRLFMEDYDKRVRHSQSKRDISSEALILEIERLLNDSRFWEGDDLDFNLEEAL